MRRKIEAYEKKLYHSGLVPAGGALFGHAAEKIQWSRESGRIPVLAKSFDRLPVKSILFARPAEPYNTILQYLAADTAGPICPDDSETRTFLVDLPVTDAFSPDAITQPLLKRKSLIIKGHGLLSVGGTGPADAYVNFSATCFACFVKFFSDFLRDSQNRCTTSAQRTAFENAAAHLPPPPLFEGQLTTGPFKTPHRAMSAITETGQQMVSLGLVDACFGNISCRVGDTLYITNSGSFLDDLAGDIAACPMDDPECTGQKPSSEFPAHMEIMRNSDATGVLHGHPLFSVIMSMDCHIDCDHKGACHRSCPHERDVCGTPIVPGETGGGPFGLYTTVPGVIKNGKSAIVYGHGVFTRAKTDFNDALSRIVEIERACRDEYFERVKGL